MLKGKNLQPRSCCLERLSFRIEGDIKQLLRQAETGRTHRCETYPKGDVTGSSHAEKKNPQERGKPAWEGKYIVRAHVQTQRHGFSWRSVSIFKLCFCPIIVTSPKLGQVNYQDLKLRISAPFLSSGGTVLMTE